MPIHFNELDIAFCVVLTVMAIRGVIRGFVAEVLSAASVVLALIVAALLTNVVSGIIISLFGESMWAPVAAFLGLFVIVYIIVKLLEGTIHHGVEKLNLENLDKALGFLLGLLEGFLAIGVILFILHLQPFIDVKEILSLSFFAQIILPILFNTVDYILKGNNI
jgi:membrane protein required for colicin V production